MTNQERRKRTRLRLKLPVIIIRSESDGPLQTETLNISNNGFYCITTQPFAPGDKLACLIVVPTRSSCHSEINDRLCLQAEVDVVRIMVNNGNGFGVGCRISNYRVLTNDAVPSWASCPSDSVSADSAEGIEVSPTEWLGGFGAGPDVFP
jgi:hypothetical protein